MNVHEYARETLIRNDYLVRILTEAGGRVGVRGFGYTIAAVDEILENPGASMTKPGGVYDSVGNLFDTTGLRVERAIRHYVETILNSPWGAQTLSKYGMSMDQNSGKLSNREILVRLAALKKKGAEQHENG